jgi:hypothetical protein
MPSQHAGQGCYLFFTPTIGHALQRQALLCELQDDRLQRGTNVVVVFRRLLERLRDVKDNTKAGGLWQRSINFTVSPSVFFWRRGEYDRQRRALVLPKRLRRRHKDIKDREKLSGVLIAKTQQRLPSLPIVIPT